MEKNTLLKYGPLAPGHRIARLRAEESRQEYKRESFELFQTLLNNLKREVTRVLFRVEPITPEQMEAMERAQATEAERARRQQQLQHDQVSGFTGEVLAQPQVALTRRGAKVGRNDPCPVVLGKKYKACHGKLV